MSLIDGMVGWMDGWSAEYKSNELGVAVRPAWQDCVWCVDMVTGSVVRCGSASDGVEGQAENFSFFIALPGTAPSVVLACAELFPLLSSGFPSSFGFSSEEGSPSAGLSTPSGFSSEDDGVS